MFGYPRDKFDLWFFFDEINNVLGFGLFYTKTIQVLFFSFLSMRYFSKKLLTTYIHTHTYTHTYYYTIYRQTDGTDISQNIYYKVVTMTDVGADTAGVSGSSETVDETTRGNEATGRRGTQDADETKIGAAATEADGSGSVPEGGA